jgi:energy-coupling factor transporter ATP-binding protein EcfA2
MMFFSTTPWGHGRMKNTIVYLIGYAGTGKYTIAKAIAGLTGAVIVDNQLINSPVFSVVGASGNTPLPAAVWPKIEGIRRIVLDTVAELTPPEASFLFTNELYEGKPMDRRWYEDVAILATKRQARLVPVILHCEPEEVCRRVTSPERAVRFKERSADKTCENIRTYQLLRVDHPNCLELEITTLSPIQAAQAILTHVEKRAP